MNLHDQLSRGFRSKTASETEALAQQFAGGLPPNSTLALHGDLGTGKTTFVRGLARAWGIREAVTSPTFNLYTIYKGHFQLIHLDAYRLSNADDLEALMIEDFFECPWCFAIEWAEHIQDALPKDTRHLHFSIKSDLDHFIQLKPLTRD